MAGALLACNSSSNAASKVAAPNTVNRMQRCRLLCSRVPHLGRTVSTTAAQQRHGAQQRQRQLLGTFLARSACAAELNCTKPNLEEPLGAGLASTEATSPYLCNIKGEKASSHLEVSLHIVG